MRLQRTGQSNTIFEPFAKSLPFVRVAVSLILSGLAWVVLVGLFVVNAQPSRAAPDSRPLAQAGTVVTHTAVPSATHEMTVFGNGQLTDQFLADNGLGTNLIGSSRLSATTIAVLFYEHASPTVDVGTHNDFSATRLMALNNPSDIPGYYEDSYGIYASEVLSYQVAQRTLAISTSNCVIMELVISNTGTISLTDGQLLYMLDIQVGQATNGDVIGYDPARQMIYQTDLNVVGFSFGISLISGDLRGYGGEDNGALDLGSDLAIRNEMITPSNAITNDPDNSSLDAVSWLVANIPDLEPDASSLLAFNLCGVTADTEDNALSDMKDTFDKIAKLSAVKKATPAGGDNVQVGDALTYTIAMSSTGSRYVDNIVVTDTIPAATNLITAGVTQGNIETAGRTVTATIGRLDPASGTVTVTIVAAPVLTATGGTLISNRAFVNSQPTITQTNIVTHQITNLTVLNLSKQAAVGIVRPNDRLTYTLTVTNAGPGTVTGVVITDAIPADTSFVTAIPYTTPVGGVVSWSLDDLALNQSRTVTLVVLVDSDAVSGTQISNTAWVTSRQQITDVDTLLTPVVTTTQLIISKSGPLTAAVQDTVIYTFTISTNAPVTDVIVSDTVAGPATYVSGDDGDGQLEPSETWLYEAAYEIPLNAPTMLQNTGIVSATDIFDEPVSASDSHTTAIEFNPGLVVNKTGPDTAQLGETVVYTISVLNATTNTIPVNQIGTLDSGDGSPITITEITDTLTDVTLISGNFRGDDVIWGTEQWLYLVTYTIQSTTPNPLTSRAIVTGEDRDNNEIITDAAEIFTFIITPSSVPDIFLPIIFKD